MSSYRYQGADEEQLRLGRELGAMGGGAARCERMGLTVFHDQAERSLLRPAPGHLGLLDAFARPGAPEAESVRRFPCASERLSDALAAPAALPLVRETVDSVLGGFNCCLVTFGERGVGKTRLALGAGPGLSGVAGAVLEGLFEGAAGLREHALMLSFCAVRGGGVFDLLADPRVRVPPAASSLALVDCPSLSVAHQVARLARERLLAGDSGEEQRGHLVLRVLLHGARRGDPPGGVCAGVYVADLVGGGATSGAPFAALSEADRASRRSAALHLQTLALVLEQLAAASTEAAEQTPLQRAAPRVTAARDSALTMLLCPVMQGSCRTSFLAVVRDGERHFAATRRTLTALLAVPRVRCASHVGARVPLSSLGAVGFRSVLPALRLEEGGAAGENWDDSLRSLVGGLRASVGAEEGRDERALERGAAMANGALLEETRSLRSQLRAAQAKLVEAEDALAEMEADNALTRSREVVRLSCSLAALSMRRLRREPDKRTRASPSCRARRSWTEWWARTRACVGRSLG